MTEINRQQRRHPAKARPVAAPGPAQTGSFHRQLQQPELVGDITASEANEIRTINSLIKHWDEEFENARKTRAAVGLYRQSILDKVISERNLDKRNVYNIDDESGRILMTHEFIEEAPGVLEVVPDEGGSDEEVKE
jgi:hypothetical protein